MVVVPVHDDAVAHRGALTVGAGQRRRVDRDDARHHGRHRSDQVVERADPLVHGRRPVAGVGREPVLGQAGRHPLGQRGQDLGQHDHARAGGEPPEGSHQAVLPQRDVAVVPREHEACHRAWMPSTCERVLTSTTSGSSAAMARRYRLARQAEHSWSGTFEPSTSSRWYTVTSFTGHPPAGDPVDGQVVPVGDVVHRRLPHLGVRVADDEDGAWTAGPPRAGLGLVGRWPLVGEVRARLGTGHVLDRGQRHPFRRRRTAGGAGPPAPPRPP